MIRPENVSVSELDKSAKMFVYALDGAVSKSV
jgi:hypothetical protein